MNLRRGFPRHSPGCVLCCCSMRLSPDGLAMILSQVGSQIGSDAHLADLLEDVPRERLTDMGVRRAFLGALSGGAWSGMHTGILLEPGPLFGRGAKERLSSAGCSSRFSSDPYPI